MQKKQQRYGFATALAVICAIGIVSVLRQFTTGLGVTALHEPVVWGLYVVCFAYFAGIGAGALTIASAAIYVGTEEYRLAARTASAVALVSLIASGLFIVLDLGRPDRAWMLLLKAAPKSPLIWDFFILNFMIVLAALFTFVTIRREVIENSGSTRSKLLGLFTIGHKAGQPAGTPPVIRRIAGVMIGGVPVLYLLTARVFASLRARPDWNTTALGSVFLVSSLLSGLAMVVVAMHVPWNRTGNPEAPPGAKRLALDVLMMLIVVDLIISLSPIATMRQWNTHLHLAVWGHIDQVAGLELVLGLFVPLAILATIRRRPTHLWTIITGILVLFGVFLKRWHIIVPAMLRRSLPLPDATYMPNTVEWTIAAGIAAFVVILLYHTLELGNRRR